MRPYKKRLPRGFGTPLTQREIQVIELIAEGKQDKEVARVLNISTGAVKTYLTNVFQRLGAKNRVAAAITWERRKHA